MPTKSKKTNNFNTASFGKKYYDIVDVLQSKIVSSIAERSNDLGLDKQNLGTINQVLLKELTSFKDWGFDQLIKEVQDQ